MGLKLGICGIGSFAHSFIPLFKAHAGVDQVVLTDIRVERADEAARRFGVKRLGHSLDDLCESDVDAIVLLTQRHLHGAQTIQALRAGKHVYCAVPMAQSLDDIKTIIDLVQQNNLIYMTGETSFYYPSTLYCSMRHQQGDFGHIFYGEAQYLHDMSHGFYDAFRHSGGDKWKQVAGFPPMFYPTHSMSMIIAVTGARATHVSCLGWVDQHEDRIFTEGGNLWDNRFSNQTSLMRMSDGSMSRINEFRRVGWSGMNNVHMSLFGTEGTFEEQANSQVWTSRTQDPIEITEQLLCSENAHEIETPHLHEALRKDFHSGMADIHPVHRLPTAYKDLPNGHFGSHQFLADDFVKAVVQHQLPPNHAWMAAKYCAPGLVAHHSSQQNGIMLEIPDFGDPPAHWTLLDPDIRMA